MVDLEELERLAKAATRGPWVVENDQFGAPLVKAAPGSTLTERTIADVDFISIPKADDNAAFIAAANPETVLALIAEIRALRAQVVNTAGAKQALVDARWSMDKAHDERDQALARVRELEAHNEDLRQRVLRERSEYDSAAREATGQRARAETAIAERDAARNEAAFASTRANADALLAASYKKELTEVEAQAAAMREALVACKNLTRHEEWAPKGEIGDLGRMVGEVVDAALAKGGSR